MRTQTSERTELKQNTKQRSDILIDIGCLVSLVNMESGGYEEYMVVSQIDADNIFEEVTAGSPVGKVLLGRSVGDIIESVAPSGNVVYKIISVRTVT